MYASRKKDEKRSFCILDGGVPNYEVFMANASY